MSRRRGWRPCLLQIPQSAGTPRSHPVHAIDRVANVMERSRRARESELCLWGMPTCTGAFVMLLHIGREPGLELAHQRAKARHDGDRLEQRP